MYKRQASIDAKAHMVILYDAMLRWIDTMHEAHMKKDFKRAHEISQKFIDTQVQIMALFTVGDDADEKQINMCKRWHVIGQDLLVTIGKYSSDPIHYHQELNRTLGQIRNVWAEG